MADHRLLVGSSLEPASYGVLMAGATATMVFQDAPHNVKINGHVSGLGKVKHAEFAMASGEMSALQFREFLAANLKALSPHLVDGAILAMCMDWRGMLALRLAMEEAKLDLINLAVWTKTNAGMGSLLRSQHELVAIAKHGRASHINNVQLARTSATERMYGATLASTVSGVAGWISSSLIRPQSRSRLSPMRSAMSPTADTSCSIRSWGRARPCSQRAYGPRRVRHRHRPRLCRC